MKTTVKTDIPSQKIGENMPKRKILTACLAPCVHVAGTVNFGNIAALLGFDSKFLGPAVKTIDIIQAIQKESPDILGLNYRLTPDNLRPILQEFFAAFDQVRQKPKRLLFAGTPQDVAIAKEFNRFEAYFEGGSRLPA